MFGFLTQYSLRTKAAGQRISSLVLSVFMLQVIAAGFCVSTASATPVSQVSAMEHCMTRNVSIHGMNDQDVVKHTCSHCNMPDANISFDKHSFDVADIVADFVVIALVPTVSDVATATFVVSPPDLQHQNTSLTTYNLNLRIRV
ncbi:MAG: hypothetical protein Q9N02_09290 [Ghiorsea sp.]|nr:hypothetical protein [Ghiorsea sp.]